MAFRILFMALGFLSPIARADVADPYNLVIATDRAAVPRALKLRKEIMETDPFVRMGDQLVVKIKILGADEMDCRRDADITRAIRCDDSNIADKVGADREKAHGIIALTSRVPRGGSGGKIAHVGAQEPAWVAIHEFMHTLGFDDEYEYEKGRDGANPEACDTLKGGAVNTILLKPRPSYSSSAAARAVHHTEIPWSIAVPSSVPLVEGTKLGTPKTNLWDNRPNPNAPGLFAGEKCKGKTVWRPHERTIMGGSTTSSFIPPLYKALIAGKMERATGHEIKLSPPVHLDCLAKIGPAELKRLPALAKFRDPLRERLEAVLPFDFIHVPASLPRIMPALRAMIDFAKSRPPACFERLQIRQTEEGDWVFGTSKFAKDSFENRSGLFVLHPTSQFGVHLRNKMKENADVCGADAADRMQPLIDAQEKIVQKIGNSAIWALATRYRARGEGEPDRADLIDEMNEDPLRNEALRYVRALLTPDLFDAYREALRRNHYFFPDFDCHARLEEIEAAKAAAAPERSCQ